MVVVHVIVRINSFMFSCYSQNMIECIEVNCTAIYTIYRRNRIVKMIIDRCGYFANKLQQLKKGNFELFKTIGKESSEIYFSFIKTSTFDDRWDKCLFFGIPHSVNDSWQEIFAVIWNGKKMESLESNV